MGQEGSDTAFPGPAWPTETFTDSKDVYFNREGIQIIHERAAHADSDSIAFFRRSDVIVIGDIMDTRRFPTINLAKGGSVQGLIAALNHVIDLAIPSIPFPWQEGGTQIIPGHGRLCEEADVVEYRDMITIIRDVVQNLIAKKMTLEQIKAAKPALGYSARYGATEGPWTTDMFVEAVYQSLSRENKK
jgi:glyoxylase-like metal-dependent hydrolase (beta-lactamase superfamily II)